MSNKIKLLRATTHANIPTLDYGEPAYVKHHALVIGNGDGTEFAVNDYNNLVNKPGTSNFSTTTALTIDTDSILNISGVHAMRLDILWRDASYTNLRLESWLVVLDSAGGIQHTYSATQDIGDTSGVVTNIWPLSPGVASIGAAITSGSWYTEIAAYPVGAATYQQVAF